MFEWRAPEPERLTLDTEYLARLGGHLGTTIMAELLADNKKLVLLAKKILHAVRNTSDGACCLCGVEQGKQHKRGSV